MMISTKGRYALRMMIDFARQGEDACVPLREVAERQGISVKYLEQLASL
ncbi:MAG: Rrf2 family transcriptional regulator, partial [Raoultibacter sp.]